MSDGLPRLARAGGVLALLASGTWANSIQPECPPMDLSDGGPQLELAFGGRFAGRPVTAQEVLPRLEPGDRLVAMLRHAGGRLQPVAEGVTFRSRGPLRIDADGEVAASGLSDWRHLDPDMPASTVLIAATYRHNGMDLGYCVILDWSQ